ncbi:MAG: hypothetical protein HQM00_12185 [Magnetococcales bacterium]|nr:hypothetical protein [Magnetococcales bacterium]
MSVPVPSRRTPPAWLIGLLLAGLGLQMLWKLQLPAPVINPQELGPPPSMAMARLTTLGDPLAVSTFWMLWLQSFDDQAGITLSLRKLDYNHVVAWLERILALNPDSEYPLLAAIRVYGFVPDPERQRQMLDFVHRAFLEAPRTRWQWLVFAALQARHRLQDAPLARRYMDDLEKNIDTGKLPFWVRGLQARILFDLNELSAARAVMGGVLLHEQSSERQMNTWLERLEEQEKILINEKK